MGDVAKADVLINLADTDLEDLYQKTPGRLQQLPFIFNGKLLSAGEAYVYAAGVWIDEASRTLSTFNPSDPATIIDMLGDRLDVITARRSELLNRGFGKRSAAEAGVKEFVDAVIERLRRGASISVVLALVLLAAILLLRGR